ncbi:MAG TPA: hypothetical protein VF715_18055 [Thermoleophilaceae bacterium]
MPSDPAFSIAIAMPGARTSALPSLRVAIVPERLESCIRRLDPADRALLDLSLNRGIPDAAMAPVLRCDPMRLAWKRARALERVASRMGMSDPADLARVRTALADLPSRAWLPLELQPAPAPAVLEPPEPAGEEPRVRREADGAAGEAAASGEAAGPAAGEVAPRPAQTLAVRPKPTASNKGEGLQRPIGRAASSPLGGLSERAKRAYPRGAMKTRVRQAAGALAIGAAAALALKRR